MSQLTRRAATLFATLSLAALTFGTGCATGEDCLDDECSEQELACDEDGTCDETADAMEVRTDDELEVTEVPPMRVRQVGRDYHAVGELELEAAQGGLEVHPSSPRFRDVDDLELEAAAAGMEVHAVGEDQDPDARDFEAEQEPAFRRIAPPRDRGLLGGDMRPGTVLR